MSVVRLSDIIVPDVWDKYVQVTTMSKTLLFTSGILRQDEQLRTLLAGGGRTINIPFWKDLADTEADIATDDPDDFATPENISTGKDIAIRQFRTHGWSTAKLTSELAGSDPAQAIGNRVSEYWTRQFQLVLVNTLRGVFQSNVDNNTHDMVNDISTDASGAAVAAELISAEAVIDTRQTMGDNHTALSMLMMHSVVYTRLCKLNLIDFIPDAEGRVNIPTYLGYPVIVDDGCPAISGTNRIRYHTYLLGPGCLGWAEVPPPMPVETIAVPAAGRGAGVDELWHRKQFGIHPYGIKWTDSSCAGQFPTNAELRNTANWSRVYVERKQVNMALLITNG